MMTNDRRHVGLVIGQLSFGGAESQLYELASALHTQRRVTVYCLSGRREPYGPRLESTGVPVRYFESRGSFDVHRVLALTKALREDRVEVVHAFLFIASAYAYLATRRIPGIKLITSARNCKREANPVRRFFVRRAFRASHAVVCNSRTMRDYAIRNYGVPPASAHVVYNGVDRERFAREPSKPPGLAAGTVGRLERQKNLPMFIEVAERVVRNRPGARFAVVGEGSLRRSLEETLANKGLTEVVAFPGVREDIAGFLADLEQFWLTSDWEGTPNVVLEAMAAGLPVIATDAGAVSELVRDGETGYVVATNDAAVFAEKSLALFSDTGLARRFGQAARRRVDRIFSIETMVRETLKIYSLAAAREK